MNAQPDPPPLPAPRETARLCLQYAWEDHIDDDIRLVMETAGDTINAMADRLERQALHLERAELRK